MLYQIVLASLNLLIATLTFILYQENCQKYYQSPLFINKITETSTISAIRTISILMFFKDFNKETICHLWFLFIMYDFGYFNFYTSSIPIMIF